MRALTVFVCLLLMAPKVEALPNFVSNWQNIYPESSSDDAGCQLCHQSPGGNQPWNSYGWDIRIEYRRDNTFDIDAAIQAVRLDDSDSDAIAATNDDEIRWSFQPGWTEGANNTVYFTDGSTLTGQSPPMLPSTTELDFPTAVNDPIPGGIPAAGITLSLGEIAAGFNAPLRAVKAPGINGSLFVVEQTGKIFRVDLATGAKTLFLDVSNDLVDINPGYDERGLLGLAFHPDFQQNGLLYTYQSEPTSGTSDFTVSSSSAFNHRSAVVEYRASDPSCNSFVQKRRTLFTIDQPQSNHNGGDLVFDTAGNLYISVGDGGGAGDLGPGHGRLGNGRNPQNILGTIIRIDPLGSNSDNGQYGVPNDNPFVASGELDEIYAYGFRNPFRMSFDAQTGNLYTGDVGQGELEEVDQVVSGGNYGWNWKEGSHFYYNPSTQPHYVSLTAPPGLPNNLVDPIGEYDHDEGISITGGYVYRGGTISGTDGRYIFGDFSGPNFATPTGRLLSMNLIDGSITEFALSSAINGYITGFGQDADNELYVVVNNQFNPGGQNGRLLKLVEMGDASTSPDATGESALCPPSEDLCFSIKTAEGPVSTICL